MPDQRPNQPDDDFATPAEGRARLTRSYLKLLAPVALVVAVAAFGALGRRPSNPPAPSPSVAAVEPSFSAGPRFGQPPPTSAYLAIDMGPDVTSASPAAAGRRIFYVAGAKTLMSLSLAAGATPRSLLTVGQCEGLEDVAASGSTLLYVVARPTTPPAEETCGAPTRLGWTIYALDLARGGTRELAHGERQDSPGDPAYPAVHIAVSGDSFAFEFPASGKAPVVTAAAGATRGAATAGHNAASSAIPPQVARGGAAAQSGPVEIVEVRSLAGGALRWRTLVTGLVTRLMLGGGRLAVQSDAPLHRVFVSDAADPAPLVAARQGHGADLSADGRYLSWDTPDLAAGNGRLTVLVRDLESGQDRVVGLDSGLPVPDASEPVVGATAQGPEVAWFATLDGGGTYPAFVDPTHPRGGLLVSLPDPVWLSIQGDDLIWVAARENADHEVAYVADLPTAQLDPQLQP